MGTEKATYTWDIDLPADRARYTKTFPKRKSATVTWELVFNPNSLPVIKNNRSTSTVFKLRLRKAPLCKILTNYSVVLKYYRNANPTAPVAITNAFTDSFEFYNNGESLKSGALHEHNICNDDCKNDIMESLNVGCLTFTIDISTCALNQITEKGCSSTGDFNNEKAKNSNHGKQLLQSVLKDPEFYDVSIQVNGTEIKAHRSILAAASPVFRATLTNNMIEKNSGCIKIDDLTADTVKLMVDFIYNGDLNLLDCESALNVLKASDKYQISELKDFCAKYIVRQINKNNALKILCVADMTNTKDLLEKSIDYIVQNFTNCMPSDFDDILKHRPNLLPLLLVKTFKTHAKSKNKK